MQKEQKTENFQATENPYILFNEWLKLAEENEINDPNAMCLSTVNADNKPSARIMLLKGLDEKGFVFYTNASSHKGTQIEQNKNAALCFHWKTLLKQVRVEGIIEEVSTNEADEYYNTRPRGSRIGAWASKQSQEIKNDGDFQKALKKYNEEFEGLETIPRPPYWRGFRVKPDSIEFWQAGEFRLHQRLVYTKDSETNWITKRLYP